MSLRLRLSILLGALAAGAVALSCADIIIPPYAPPCAKDSDCEGGAICFADGCGDPGHNLKLQVTFLNQSQEFEVPDLHATLDQELKKPAAFSGKVTQQTATGEVPFNQGVVFKGIGSALLLPGIGRRIENTVQPLAGQYLLPVSSGQYGTISVYSATDNAIPPVQAGDGRTWLMGPGGVQKLDVAFPATNTLLPVTGTLVLAAPLAVSMQVQVLELTSHRPLSQPRVVDALGGFTLLVSPTRLGDTVEILATPKDAPPDTIVPTTIFSSISLRPPLIPLILEVGNFGPTVTLSGTVLDSAGEPVADAAISTERQLTPQDMSNYSSPAVFSGPDGRFTVKSLATLSGGPITLWVIPPTRSLAGILQKPVVVPLAGGPIGELRCPRRVPVHGKVLRPAGDAPAAGVLVRAEPVGGVEGRKPPDLTHEATADPNGEFLLHLDPAEYRLDFISADTLPKVSRRVIVSSQSDSVEVPTFNLWNGRKLTGTITGFATSNASTVSALDGANVELFRVVTEGGKNVSYSLGKVTTDGNGGYSMVIPTVPPAGQPSETPDAGTGGTDAGP